MARGVRWRANAASGERRWRGGRERHSVDLPAALRADPAHASELAVLYALPQFAAHVAAWRDATVAGHPNTTPEQLAKRSAERSDIDPGFTLPPRPSTRLRRRLVAAVLVTAGGLVVLGVVFSGGPQGLRRHWLATTVAALFVILTVGRLLWTTRPPRAPA